MPDRKVVDIEEARRRLEAARVGGMVTELTSTLLPELGAVEPLLLSGRSLSGNEAHDLAAYLAQVMRTGLCGMHARTWAASLLTKLGGIAGPAISGDDGLLVEEARAALAGFDAVAYGTVSPRAMRAFVIDSEVGLPHPAQS